jgi:hypothetical protein
LGRHAYADEQEGCKNLQQNMVPLTTGLRRGKKCSASKIAGAAQFFFVLANGHLLIANCYLPFAL